MKVRLQTMTAIDRHSLIVRSRIAWSTLAILIAANGCSQSSIATSAAKESASQRGAMVVSSSDIPSGGECSSEYVHGRTGASPPIEWSGAPANTKRFALSLWRFNEDKIANISWTDSYWLLYNIPADVTKLPKDVKGIGQDGYNDRSIQGFCPLKSKFKGDSNFHVTVYALSEELEFDEKTKVTRKEFMDAIEGRVLAQGTLDFHYDNTKKLDQSKK